MTQQILGTIGALLELAGVILVIYGLRDIVGEWRRALRVNILGARPTIHVAGGLASGSAEVHGYADAEITGTVEDQLTALKNQLSAVTRTLATQDQQMRAQRAETSKSLEHERAERDQANKEIRERLHGNARLEAVGALFVVAGLVLTVIAPWVCT